MDNHVVRVYAIMQGSGWTAQNQRPRVSQLGQHPGSPPEEGAARGTLFLFISLSYGRSATCLSWKVWKRITLAIVTRPSAAICSQVSCARDSVREPCRPTDRWSGIEGEEAVGWGGRGDIAGG